MTENINHDYITDYIRSLLPEREGIFSEIEQAAVKEESYVPIVEPETAQLLRLFIDMLKPRRILEIGTAVGYSAMLMAAHAGGNTHITTIERYEKAAAAAAENFRRAGFSKQITLLEGDAGEILPDLSGEYEMVFLDGAKGQYPSFLPHITRLLKAGGVLISDNVLYKGMTASHELLVRRKITIVKRLRVYLETLMKDKNFTTSIIPIGDGVAISYKKD